MATVVSQQPDQPIVEATDFHHRNERFATTVQSPGKLRKELLDLLRSCRKLPGLNDITAFIAERNGKLACVLVDSKVQHSRSSPVKKG